MEPKIITVIGSLNVDFVSTVKRIPGPGETLTGSDFMTAFGGKGANQAVACARLSRTNPTLTVAKASNPPISPAVTVKMIGAVGDDSFGHGMIKSMKEDGVDVDGIKVVKDQTTGIATIIVEEETGENRIILVPGANHYLDPSHFLEASQLGEPLPDLIILQLEIPLPTVLQILKTAKAAHVPVLLNPAPAVPLPTEVYEGLSHLIINETEAEMLSSLTSSLADDKSSDKWDVITKEFVARGVENVVVTLGAKGAFWTTKGIVDASTPIVDQSQKLSDFVPAEKVKKVVDTTAAGDTWVGAYAVSAVRGHLAAKGIHEVVKYACKASARTVERKGAQKSIPWENEVV